MKGPIFLVLVLAAKLAYCSSVTADGNSSLHLFFCEPKGCAANVTSVYCGNIELLNGTNIPDCSGHPPLLNTVCQRDGRAFVQTEAGIKCDFEAKGHFIKTVKCEDSNTACTFDPEATLKEEKKEEKKEEEKEEKREEKKEEEKEGKKEENNAGHIAGIY
ncbi:PREDICTED: uncharacterized protein LOC103357072 [Xyrichtys novacula]|uniref:PREDICTED: uncharacterized protein LOC103357072 n=1 Tax=Xyrichtys novacula TaxID=13765 RepID=A0AAV1G897_XYRNO|nr:PREDICTED: uncharacterized protein LOC103357072 [Xyrichtys novacula]